MLQVIGLIVAIYVALRCLDFIGSNPARHRSEGWNTLVVIAAIFALLAVGYLTLSLLLASA